MKIKYSEDLPIHEVPSLPSSVPAILYQGTVLVCKSCANELLQMGFGSMFGSGIVVQANPNEDLQLRPNPSNYSLVLHDEEALYLLEVGVLKIIPHSSSSTTLDVSTVSYTVLLQLFTSKRANFPLNYKVYCYFKFRG